MSEWHFVSLVVGLLIGFVSGLTYALWLYKQMEAKSDREWAKRRGMQEVGRQPPELPVRMTPILRHQRL